MKSRKSAIEIGAAYTQLSRLRTKATKDNTEVMAAPNLGPRGSIRFSSVTGHLISLVLVE